MCDSLHVHISQFFMHCLPSTSVHVSDCCSICDLIFVFFYFYFVCLIMSRVFMCHVCMVFTPTTSITYYCFMICLLVCTSMLCNFFSILLLCSLVISAKKANFLEIKLWYPASCHQLLLNLLSTIVKVLHISYTFQLAVFLKKDY